MGKSHVFRFNPAEFQEKILFWYQKNKRTLPWRVANGGKTDPYRVWLSEIMLQQTTVPTVIPYFLKFTEKWPDVVSLAAAPDQEVMTAWAGLGYYARARNLLKCARQVANEGNGKFPTTIEGLMELPGIGPYTAAAIAAIAYGQQATVVDGNIERIASRIFALTTPLPQGKKDIRLAADQLFNNISTNGKKAAQAFPQALMDLGAGVCLPKSPRCGICPMRDDCQAYALGRMEEFPVKAPKKSVPTRKGDVFWITDKRGFVLLEKRPDHRMLGGMVGLPTTDWDLGDGKLEKAVKRLDFAAYCPRQIGHIYHSFTHFKLELGVWVGTIVDFKSVLKSNPDMFSVNFSDTSLRDVGFPTVFLKVAKFVQQSLSK